jgi:O-antigen/teichoic acid export membrane protein
VKKCEASDGTPTRKHLFSVRDSTIPMQKRIDRSLGCVGFASSVVGALDAVALVMILGWWATPEQFGIASLAVWLFPILDCASELGLTSALIQDETRTPRDESTAFWLGLAVALVCLGLLALGAPILGRASGQPIVTAMLLAYGAKLAFQNVFQIPMALMRKQLRFGELSIIRIAANVAEFAGKVGLAWSGHPIAAFVGGALLRVLVTGIGVQWCSPWRPRFELDRVTARRYLAFGAKTSASQLLYFFYTNVDYPIVGHTFGATALGYYRIAYELVLYPVRYISEVVIQVAFPVFARLRSRRDELVDQFVGFSRRNVLAVLPFVIVVLAFVEPILHAIFPRYLPAATAARVLCIVGVMRAFSFVFPPLLDGVGRPGRTLVYNVVAAVLLPIAFVLSAHVLGPRLGFLSVAIAWAVAYPFAFAAIVAMGLAHLELTPLEFLRRLATRRPRHAPALVEEAQPAE